jgi:hypothetical protein
LQHGRAFKLRAHGHAPGQEGMRSANPPYAMA